MFRAILWFLASIILMLSIAMGLRSPWNEANFQPQYKFLPKTKLVGEKLFIEQLRDFRYNLNGQIIEANYVDAEYNINLLKKTWFGISHFAPMGMAHVFISFEFSDGQYLVVSAEARMQEKDKGYNPVAGLFRAYTKIIVLATEQDVIGLRSHIRTNETLYLYPLKIDELEQKALLLGYLRAANALTAEAIFYNTLLDNCMLTLLAESYRFRGVTQVFDQRILLPGYADEFILEEGLIAYPGDIDRVRGRALVDGQRFSIDDPNYSKKIRKLEVFN